MADTKRKITITQDDAELPEESFDAEAATPANLDDADTGAQQRQPIDLDTPVDLSEAVAAATETPSAQATFGGAASGAGFEAERQQLQAQLAEANDKYLRTLADMQNFRRRGEEERARIQREGNERLIKELLPVLDDFILAVAAAKNTEGAEQIIGGVEAILRKLQDTLTKQGVEPIEAVGLPFNPDLHEAVMVEEDSDQPDETVTADLRKGYTLHGRVIRPSMVKVAKAG